MSTQKCEDEEVTLFWIVPLALSEGLMNAIETHMLTRTFETRVAVDDLTLAIPDGSVFGFLGPNGAGKTTTVRMLTALIAPSAGEATIAGYTLGKENDAIRRSVGILTETPGLYDRLSALQNLVFFARLYGLEKQKAQMQTEHYLRLLDLWERRNDKVGSFSKGMRQKLAIARALLHEPRVVFLDEPTSGLDPEAAHMVHDFIKELRSEGRTIFLTTHNLYEADQLCDLVAIFRTHVLRIDTPANLRASLYGSEITVRVVGTAQRWLEGLQELLFIRSITAQEDTLTVRLDNPDRQNPLLIRTLVTAGAEIRYVEALNHSLEEAYLKLIGEQESTHVQKV